MIPRCEVCEGPLPLHLPVVRVYSRPVESRPFYSGADVWSDDRELIREEVCPRAPQAVIYAVGPGQVGAK